MPTKFERCDRSVTQMADAILEEFETHQATIDAKVKIDFVFAYADPESDAPALQKNGVRAYGICRKTSLKERALGHGDIEISIDGDWWKDASDAQRRALLDHELHHIAVDEDLEKDDLGRPLVSMRKHDFEFGWFSIIAQRHGADSMECRQAKAIADNAGQLYWPALGVQTT